MIKKKVLLMGRHQSGKTSMRSIIFQNTLPSLTSRLGATIEVEQSHQRFLGSLVLNLWDCAGQKSFLESYISAQKSTIFAHVGVLIYVFDVETSSQDWMSDLKYFRECLKALLDYSPEATAFVLIHKMDRVSASERSTVFAAKRHQLLQHCVTGTKVSRVFGTSIWDETLYKAWSQIVHTLVPNATALKRGLTTLTRACGAVEAVLFEKTTFLLIAHSEGIRSTADENLLSASASTPSSTESGTSTGTDTSPSTPGEYQNSLGSTAEKLRQQQLSQLSGNRFERISSLLKTFKLSSPSWSNEKWIGLHMQLPEFTAVIEPLTVNSYVMVLCADDRILPEAIKVNIRMAKQKFEDLQAGTV